MKQSGLKKAEKLFRARRYGDVISHLEPQIFLYRDNPRFYYLLGMACLRTNDAGGAYSYLSRTLHLDRDNIEARLGLAVAHLRRRETQDALQTWLAVLDLQPNNVQAKRGLDLVRNAESDSDIVEALDKGATRRLLPGAGIHVPPLAYVIPALVALAAAAYFLAPPVVESLLEQRASQREGAQVVELAEQPGELVAYSGQFRLTLTEKEVRTALDRIQEYFNSYRDNMAMREINRLLNSNAHASVKQKALLLTDYIQEPTFSDMKDNFAYAEVSDRPWLYTDCYVRWRGRISNLNIGSREITFDLLVGYETEQVLEGVVPVSLNFATDLQPGQSVEVIGRVVGEDRLQRIEGVSIRLIRPQNEG